MNTTKGIVKVTKEQSTATITHTEKEPVNDEEDFIPQAQQGTKVGIIPMETKELNKPHREYTGPLYPTTPRRPSTTRSLTKP